jgi:hypothetical protein
MQEAREGCGGLEHAGVARGVVHGAQSAHRQPGDRAPRAGAVVALEDPAQLAEVEGLPRGPAVAPVRVEAHRSRLRRDHEHVAQPREVFDVGLPRPRVVGVAAPGQQVQDRPPLRARAGGPTVGRDQANLRGCAERGRADAEVDDPRRDTALGNDGRRTRAVGRRTTLASARGEDESGERDERYRSPSAATFTIEASMSHSTGARSSV